MITYFKSSFYKINRRVFPVFTVTIIMLTGFFLPFRTAPVVAGSVGEWYTMPVSGNQPAEDDGVRRIVDEMPEIIGGLEELYRHLNYPDRALRANIEGRVVIQFIIDEHGNVHDPEILRDIGGGCGQAAVDAVKKLNFTPGIQDGRAVPVLYALPITFRIN